MMEDESGGLKGVYKWTMDALFGGSPSSKYVKDKQRYAQDDTNYGQKKSYLWSQSRSRSRSNSWCASIPNERSFYEKYDLLPSIPSDHESDQDIEFTISPERFSRLNSDYINPLSDVNNKKKTINGKLLRPVPVVPRGQTQMGQGKFEQKEGDILYRDPTDTFAKRKKNQRSSPTYDSHDGVGNTGFLQDSNNASGFKVDNRDPLIARLFGKSFQSPVKNKVADLPGKFPSPLKQQPINANTSTQEDSVWRNDAGSTSTDEKEYLKKYMDIFLSIDQNNELLAQVNDDIDSKSKQHIVVDTKYKEKYLAMRNELIKELKQSKRTHDNYYVLYNKYKELKTIANGALSMKSTIYQLESEILEQNVSKNREIQELNEKVLDLEKKFRELQTSKDAERERYELRIAALEAQLRDQQKDRNYFSDYSYSHRSREFSPVNSKTNYFSEDISDYDADYPYKNMYR